MSDMEEQLRLEKEIDKKIEFIQKQDALLKEAYDLFKEESFINPRQARWICKYTDYLITLYS